MRPVMPNAVRGSDLIPFARRSGWSAPGRFPPPSRERRPRRGPRSGRSERVLPRLGAWAFLELRQGESHRVRPRVGQLRRRFPYGNRPRRGVQGSGNRDVGRSTFGGRDRGRVLRRGPGRRSQVLQQISHPQPTSAATSPRRLHAATAARPRARYCRAPAPRIPMQHSSPWTPEPFGPFPGISPSRLRSLAVSCHGAGGNRRRCSQPACVHGHTVEDSRERGGPGCIATSSGST
jgi:hypothetical protein